MTFGLSSTDRRSINCQEFQDLDPALEEPIEEETVCMMKQNFEVSKPSFSTTTSSYSTDFGGSSVGSVGGTSQTGLSITDIYNRKPHSRYMSQINPRRQVQNYHSTNTYKYLPQHQYEQQNVFNGRSFHNRKKSIYPTSSSRNEGKSSLESRQFQRKQQMVSQKQINNMQNRFSTRERYTRAIKRKIGDYGAVNIPDSPSSPLGVYFHEQMKARGHSNSTPDYLMHNRVRKQQQYFFSETKDALENENEDEWGWFVDPGEHQPCTQAC